MANIKSQKKRILTNEKRRVRNRTVSSALKTYIKKVDEAVAAADLDAATSAFRKASRELDIAAAKGVIHRNNAANKKSTLARRVNAAS